MTEKVKGNRFYLNHNATKTGRQPDFKGNYKLTTKELQSLIELYKRYQAKGEEPILQVDMSAWLNYGDDGSKSVGVEPEIWMGERKKKAEEPSPFADDFSIS